LGIESFKFLWHFTESINGSLFILRCDEPQKLKKLNKLNRKVKVILMATVAASLEGFEPGSSYAHNTTDGAQNCPILRSPSRTNQEIPLFRGN